MESIRPLRWLRPSHWSSLDVATKQRLSGAALAFAGAIFGKETVIWIWNRALDGMAAAFPSGSAMTMAFSWADGAGLALFAVGAALFISGWKKPDPTSQLSHGDAPLTLNQNGLACDLQALSAKMSELRQSNDLTALRCVETLRAQYALSEMLRLQPQILRLGKLLDRARNSETSIDWEQWYKRYQLHARGVEKFARFAQPQHDVLIKVLAHIPNENYKPEGWSLDASKFPGNALHDFKTFRYIHRQFEEYADGAIDYVRMTASV